MPLVTSKLSISLLATHSTLSIARGVSGGLSSGQRQNIYGRVGLLQRRNWHRIGAREVSLEAAVKRKVDLALRTQKKRLLARQANTVSQPPSHSRLTTRGRSGGVKRSKGTLVDGNGLGLGHSWLRQS